MIFDLGICGFQLEHLWVPICLCLYSFVFVCLWWFGHRFGIGLFLLMCVYMRNERERGQL